VVPQPAATLISGLTAGDQACPGLCAPLRQPTTALLPALSERQSAPASCGPPEYLLSDRVSCSVCCTPPPADISVLPRPSSRAHAPTQPGHKPRQARRRRCAHAQSHRARLSSFPPPSVSRPRPACALRSAARARSRSALSHWPCASTRHFTLRPASDCHTASLPDDDDYPDRLPALASAQSLPPRPANSPGGAVNTAKISSSIPTSARPVSPPVGAHAGAHSGPHAAPPPPPPPAPALPVQGPQEVPLHSRQASPFTAQATPSTVHGSPLPSSRPLVSANGESRPAGPRRPEQPRMRASVACERCRRSKIKCTNNGVDTGCVQCLSKGRECQYTSSAPTTTTTRRESIIASQHPSGDHLNSNGEVRSTFFSSLACWPACVTIALYAKTPSCFWLDGLENIQISALRADCRIL
jgi:hypothetical protein